MHKNILTIALVLITLTVYSQALGLERPPVVAGAFYPADSTSLDSMVRDHLRSVRARQDIDGAIVAMIVPHAGLIYSGAIAAHCYKLLEGSEVNKVVLCGPSHRYPFQGASVYGAGIEWRTPLGLVSCDDELCEAVVRHDGVNVVPAAHNREHSLEVQLPYLQTVLPGVRIVPIAIGHQTERGIGTLATALESLEYDTQTIMVASTDWQHYRPVSVGAPMDSLGIDCLLDLDPTRLASLLASGEVEMCGGGAAVAVTRAAMAKGANRAQLLRYGDSGEQTGDKKSVVGYAAIVLYRQHDSTERAASTSSDQEEPSVNQEEPYRLSDTHKKRLLQIARQSIASFLKSGKLPAFEVPDILAEPGAAFVTLEKQATLRGCIGFTHAVQPLYRTVAECAVKAAIQDDRFSPVTAEELPDLHIEISVLTPMEEVKSLDEIKIGRDGLMIELGQRRGLLLPQVAVDKGWNRTAFLEKTCWKAGLPEEAYKSPEAVIYRYQALIFGE
ncbi:MAG: AmmeMemoRadiSam system protein B [candidate division Zixibacteria bacterium]|nr:AmmeMemoRadiSam system protein B [candidate division Zixibacteria bacterium]MDH3938232.1 AmmeMemoRadiSam system protein B [candidate division Zixibacteria bacterium]MDH4033295.1 AmmeMemoRadiSam system protein B [candidate division Zixibacteria bacterium]